MAPTSLVFIYALLLAGFQNGYVVSQSNYDSQANNVDFEGKGLPEQTVLNGEVTKLDDLSPVILLNRTRATLNCAAGSMDIDLKFNEPFYGIAYADFDRNSACQVAGKGDHSYRIELPLKGCGTRQDPQRVFTNNIVVRFHPGLEMDGDEVITIVCRYPSPVAIKPLPLPILLPETVETAPLLNRPSGLQILLIICTIMFLSLLLLGLGVSYYCLRRRHLTVVRRHPLSVMSGSEITKLSGSSLGNISMFEGLKIPRAHAPVAATASSSGSEGPLISDTLPSDYPSESHSEAEDVDTRSIPASSAGSFENKAFVQEIAHEIPQPKFDVQVRVKRQAPSPSPQPSSSETEASIAARNLSTILEQREEDMQRTHFTYVPEIHAPPKYIQPAPVYSRIMRHQQEKRQREESHYVDEVDEPPVSSARSIASLNTEMTDTHSMTEMVDSSHSKYIAPTPPPPPPIIPQYTTEVALSRHQPEITSHVVDDVFLKTVTEKRTIEDIERHRRLITEYHTRPKPQNDQKWDVTIRNLPPSEGPDGPEWENFSDISSASGLTLTPKPERAQMSLPPQSFVNDTNIHLYSPELVGNIGQPPMKTFTASHEVQKSSQNYISTLDIPIENPSVPNWDVLIRILKPDEFDDETTETLKSQLSTHDKVKWRQIITTESTLRTLLTEAVVREDYERIRRDQRYERLFEPPKWDVIIRILSPPERPPKNTGPPGRYRKKSDWDTRSRRSSLPTLYEYDSDGGSSVRTLTNNEAPLSAGVVPQLNARRGSRSSYRSEADLRSMSEVIVDFARPDHIDSQSDASSYYHRGYDDETDVHEYRLDRASSQRSLVRSLSQPSLARSASEFTERWIAPVRYDTASEFTSPETTPKSQRSTRIRPQLRAQAPPPPLQGGNSMAAWQAASSSQHQLKQGGGAMTSRMMSQQYVSETATSFQSKGNWFADDNESEISYK